MYSIPGNRHIIFHPAYKALIFLIIEMKLIAKKKLSNKVKNKLPDLFKHSGTLIYNLEHYFECWEGKDLIGAIQLEYDKPVLVKFKPQFSLFIYNFEIVPGKRNKGYGKTIIENLLPELPIYEVELMYWNEDSRRFWSKLGFRVINKETKLMKKKIKK